MQTGTQLSKQRTERRIAVRLPMQVTGRDSRGVVFTEETSSENLCRGGAAFVTRFELAVGSDLDIRIPLPQHRSGPRGSRGTIYRALDVLDAPRSVSLNRVTDDSDFATRGRVVHVSPATGPGERLIGVQFTGPRFQRVFRSESAA